MFQGQKGSEKPVRRANLQAVFYCTYKFTTIRILFLLKHLSENTGLTCGTNYCPGCGRRIFSSPDHANHRSRRDIIHKVGVKRFFLNLNKLPLNKDRNFVHRTAQILMLSTNISEWKRGF